MLKLLCLINTILIKGVILNNIEIMQNQIKSIEKRVNQIYMIIYVILTSTVGNVLLYVINKG